MNAEKNIYDGCEFDENQNIDWDALEITEELALQIGGPIPGLGSIYESSKKHSRETSNLDDEDNDNIKFMRFGSLGRIIASSFAASTPPVSFYAGALSQQVSLANDVQRSETIKNITVKFINSFNFGDMGRLALLVREICEENCLLLTPDVDQRISIVGRADVMMLFSLMFETFPDGVYRTLSTTVDGDRVTTLFSFTGTRVFDQSIDCLYKQCRRHAAESSASAASKVNPDHYGCELDLIQISKTTTQNFVSIQLQQPNQNSPKLSGILQKLPPNQQINHYNPFQSLQNKFSETVTHLMPHAGRLASEALKEGPMKNRRTMEMHFDSNDQIVKIIFQDAPPTAVR
jgi:hypothetical protein